jgi:hypothetical protein
VSRHEALLAQSIAKRRAFEQPGFLARCKPTGEASLLHQSAQRGSIV